MHEYPLGFLRYPTCRGGTGKGKEHFPVKHSVGDENLLPDLDEMGMDETSQPESGFTIDALAGNLVSQDLRAYRVVCRFDVKADRSYEVILEPC